MNELKKKKPITRNIAKSGEVLNWGGFSPFGLRLGLIRNHSQSASCHIATVVAHESTYNIERNIMKKIKSNHSLILLIAIISSMVLGCSKKNYPTSIGPIDGDGNHYKTVIVGNQEWFAENLKTTKYNDGKSISQFPIGDGRASYYWYNNDTINKEIYGALYNWNAATKKKLCPYGWRLPSRGDWLELENFLRLRNQNVAKALSSTHYWQKSNIPGSIGNNQHENNTSGFSALPAGSLRAKDEKYRLLETSAFFWTSTKFKEQYTYSPFLHFSRDSVGHPNLIQTGAHSVRCIKTK
jgi:uncharacterized protein (TIGR02145 family)